MWMEWVCGTGLMGRETTKSRMRHALCYGAVWLETLCVSVVLWFYISRALDIVDREVAPMFRAGKSTQEAREAM